MLGRVADGQADDQPTPRLSRSSRIAPFSVQVSTRPGAIWPFRRIRSPLRRRTGPIDCRKVILRLDAASGARQLPLALITAPEHFHLLGEAPHRETLLPHRFQWSGASRSPTREARHGSRLERRHATASDSHMHPSGPGGAPLGCLLRRCLQRRGPATSRSQQIAENLPRRSRSATTCLAFVNSTEVVEPSQDAFLDGSQPEGPSLIPPAWAGVCDRKGAPLRVNLVSGSRVRSDFSGLCEVEIVVWEERN